MLVIASDGADSVICVWGVGGAEEDPVCGAAGLCHIQDLWSTWRCSRTGRLSCYTQFFLFKIVECYKIAHLLPVSCVFRVQVRLHPRRSLQGVTVTE